MELLITWEVVQEYRKPSSVTFQRNVCKIHQTLHFISLKKNPKKHLINTELARFDPTLIMYSFSALQPTLSNVNNYVIHSNKTFSNSGVKQYCLWLTSESPVRLRHAGPTPNSRGHQSDHTSLWTRHIDWRSSNTGWSQRSEGLVSRKLLT